MGGAVEGVVEVDVLVVVGGCVVGGCVVEVVVGASVSITVVVAVVP